MIKYLNTIIIYKGSIVIVDGKNMSWLFNQHANNAIILIINE